MEHWRFHRRVRGAWDCDGCRDAFPVVDRLDEIRIGDEQQCPLHLQLSFAALFCRILRRVRARAPLVLGDPAEQDLSVGPCRRCHHRHPPDVCGTQRPHAVAVVADAGGVCLCDGYMPGFERRREGRDDQMARSERRTQKTNQRAGRGERIRMKINSKDFRVREGDEVNLKKWPTSIKPVYKSKEQYHKILTEHVAQLSTQQQLLYASNSYAVLMIFQAMDAAGKDGAIKHVMSGVNPQGCQVFSFKHPSPAELEHDFLWRTTRDLPARGRIGIFNRSYYEEVLIARVHPEILRGEGIPDGLLGEKTVWHNRYRSITNLERHLSANGTRIIKFFLHLSKEEQRKRFLERTATPEKN